MHHKPPLLFTLLTTTITALASSLPSTLSSRSIDQQCVPAALNLRFNGIPQSFFYAFADACKAAIYPNDSAETRTADAGGPVPALPQLLRYSSEQEGWAIRFEYFRPGSGQVTNPCLNLNIRCSDLVGKEATGQTGDIGDNIAVCSKRNRATRVKMDSYYHGGARPYTKWDTNGSGSGFDRVCATTLVWRCAKNECGPEFDDHYDPRIFKNNGAG
ncbi:MAG: hypothetical protein Q9160_009090 [Pyrenula sp. 1 TL-2023]